MKANELRINNWVRQRESDTYIQIEQYLLCNEELCHYQPITITEEWLLKLGFERDNQGNWRLKSGYHWIELYFYHVYINGQQVVLIDYVHQLQNIWFALTGKELTHGGNK
jgi:hypothetical protein